MLRNYLKVTLRNLFRQKGYALVNIFGLAVGIASCLIILRYVQFEQSFDRFHEKADRIHRVEMIVNGGEERWAKTRNDLADYLKDTFPEVEGVARLSYKDEPLVAFDGRRFFESYFRYADPSIFELFDIEILRGSANDLARPGTVMLTTSIAEKYFGSQNPIGKVLEVSNKWDQEVESYEVVGLIREMPANSHFTVEFLASMATEDASHPDRSSRICQTYILLKEGASIEAFDNKLASLDANGPGWLDERTSLQTIPLTRIHLYGESMDATDMELQGDVRLVYLFSLIALLIIVLACINYMNLATARAAQRAREVGVRKVVGAGRRQLVFQFLGESFLFVLAALAIAVFFAQATLPLFNNLLNKEFVFDWKQAEFLQSVLIGAVVVALVAGSYPAFLLSGFQPSSVLTGTLKSSTWPLLRKGLVVFQFAVTIGFIAATFVIYRQLNYVTSERLGFEQDQRLVLLTRDRLGDKAPAFKEALSRQAVVRQVSLASGVPSHPTAISFFQGKDFEASQLDPEAGIMFDHLWVDEDYVATFGLQLLEGRSFSSDFSTDDQAVIINETAVKTLGWENAVGKSFFDNDVKKTITGVVADFHLFSLKQEIRPVMLEMHPASTFVTLHLSTTNLGQGLSMVEALWDEYIPSLPFQYAFLDQEVEAMYREEVRLGRLFALFSGLAVLVACLGLFGLAAYTSLLRTKEIGIRKILGASTSGLVSLLSKDYLRLVIYAFLAAAPISYFLMDDWLQGFVYRVNLSVWIFIGAGLVTLLIAVVTVSYQSIKTSIANPVEALRYE